jgi:hypothetical protein
MDHVNLNASGPTFQQQVGKLPASLVVIKDVGFQVDVVPRGTDGREHRLVGCRAVLQQGQFVAQHQRAIGIDRLLVGKMFLQHLGGAGLPLQAGENGVASCCRDCAMRILELYPLSVGYCPVALRVRESRTALQAQQTGRDQSDMSAERVYEPTIGR